MFLGSHVFGDPQNINDDVNKIFGVMEMTCNDRVDFASYKLKVVAYIWFTQRKQSRGRDAARVTWKCFTRDFMDNLIRMRVTE